MQILQIENIIDKNIDLALARGMTIISGGWGIRNIEGALDNQSNWISLDNRCCALATILLNKENKFKSYNEKIKYQTYPYLKDLLEVNYEWLHSFMMGYEMMRVGYWTDQEAYNLGFKTRTKYIGIEIWLKN